MDEKLQTDRDELISEIFRNNNRFGLKDLNKNFRLIEVGSQCN